MTALKAFGRLLWSPVRPSENWAQTLVRVAGNLLRWVIGLPILVGLLGWGVFSFHSWWKDRPYRLTGLEGVEIGMTPTEVTLIKGAPKYIIPILSEVAFDEIKFTPEKRAKLAEAELELFELLRQKAAMSTAQEAPARAALAAPPPPGAAELMSFDDVEVYFDRSSEGASQVARICLSQLAYSNGVIGITGTSTEAEVIRHLGQPDSVEIYYTALSKWSSFERYNLVVRFEKARVVGICVGT